MDLSNTSPLYFRLKKTLKYLVCIAALQALITMPASAATSSFSAYFIGNSLSWDALNSGALDDLFLKGGVSLSSDYHIRCSSSLASTYSNTTDPCVVSGDGTWDTALPVNSYDLLVLQPHETGSTEDEIAAINAYAALNSASLVIYEAYPGYGPAGDLEGFYAQPDQSDFAQTKAEFAQIRAAFPDAIYVPGMEVLLAFDQMARNGEIDGIFSAQDLYRDGRHLDNFGKYLLGLTFFTAITGLDPAMTGLDLHTRYDGVTTEQAILAQGLVADTLISPVPVPAAVWLFGSALIGLVCIKRRH